jgi:HSP20 family molecular chaperone IbpA
MGGVLIPHGAFGPGRLRMAHPDGNLWLTFSRLGARAKRSDDGYPPYNMELLPENERGAEVLRITLAVAGFGPDDLEVSVENGELAIRGARSEESRKDYFHHGIAARRFERTFALAKGVKVRKAELHHGLLAIELERPDREKRVLKVGILPAGWARAFRRQVAAALP